MVMQSYVRVVPLVISPLVGRFNKTVSLAFKESILKTIAESDYVPSPCSCKCSGSGVRLWYTSKVFHVLIALSVLDSGTQGEG